MVRFTCKRIAWEAYLDMPVGLTLRPAPCTGTEMIIQIIMERNWRMPSSAGT